MTEGKVATDPVGNALQFRINARIVRSPCCAFWACVFLFYMASCQIAILPILLKLGYSVHYFQM